MQITKEPRAIVTSQIPSQQRDQLAALAQRADRSLSAEIRKAIAEHLERSQAQG